MRANIVRCAVLLAVISLAANIAAHAETFSSLSTKHIVGYQGWFSCPRDPVDLGWFHWFRGKPRPDNLTVDLWPDLAGFAPDELCPTDFKLNSGAPAFVFSSENAKTVRRHFSWMRAYGVDGAAVQRFVSQIDAPTRVARVDLVLHNIRAAAEAEGRGFFVMYDLSGIASDTAVQSVESDWRRLAAEGLTASPAYMGHRGRPVVGVWGLGIGDRKATPAQALELIRFFKSEARVTLLGGVPAYWRTLGDDSRKEPEWSAVYAAFDIISPWTVGRYATPALADKFAKNVLQPDIAEAKRRGQDYMPVVFPGFSWTNLRRGAAPPNQIPRLCGAFYKRQIDNALRAGANMLYTAMFDELDEGTAIMKVTSNSEQMPSTAVAPDANCPGANVLYLRLAGEAARGLRTGQSGE